ncbi:hypothetical protein NLJ89_g11638 [Agrocybe chaxingu]|uniref:Uncharacterized protein n=1 Tax=Agrocybe chaxingu TaxID=84603 RepID=A0A9W8MP73_9AGAR|nr:hypothetical protein NLJ89_g11638 [Agrocybe chaxingu]
MHAVPPLPSICRSERSHIDLVLQPLPITEPPYYTIAQDNVVLPPDPALSERELLTMHAEIKVVQARYGLSYKDAAHRVHLQEVARLEAEDNAMRTFAVLQARLDHLMNQEIIPPVEAIDSGAVDMGGRPPLPHSNVDVLGPAETLIDPFVAMLIPGQSCTSK